MSSGDSPLDSIGIEKIGSKPKSKTFYPFAYSLLESTKNSFCWYCLQENVKLTCDECGVAKFCSKECQSTGTFDHKYECSAIKKCPELNVEERMLIRLVGRHKDITEGNDKTIDGFYANRESQRTLMELWHHTEQVKNDDAAMLIFTRIYDKVLDVCDPKYMMDKDTVFEIHCRNFINRHSISNVDYLREIGKGLYLDLCRYDHSCRPNTIYSCNGVTASLRALHDNVDLDDIENTHYTYIELPPCKIQRRHMLKETWYFECHCERCDDPLDNWLTAIICPTCLDKSDIRKTVKIHGPEAYENEETLEIVCNRCHVTLEREYIYISLEGMRTIRRTMDSAEEEALEPMELLKVYQGLLISYEKILPMSNAYFCQLIAAMIPLVQQATMTRKQRIVASLDLHAKCEPFVRYVYRYAHPSKAMHLLQMGQMHHELGNGKDAARYIVEAHRIMDYMFGKGHCLSNQTKSLMDAALSNLVQFQRSFVNVIERLPEAKQNLEERFLRAEEREERKNNGKSKNKNKKKNKTQNGKPNKNGESSSKISQNGKLSVNGESTTKKTDDGLDDLPELIAEL